MHLFTVGRDGEIAVIMTLDHMDVDEEGEEEGFEEDLIQVEISICYINRGSVSCGVS